MLHCQPQLLRRVHMFKSTGQRRACGGGRTRHCGRQGCAVGRKDHRASAPGKEAQSRCLAIFYRN